MGRLPRAKSAIDEEMAASLTALLVEARVAIISGGALPQFEKQVLGHFQQHFT